MQSVIKTVFYACLALLAFAGNSLLARLALAQESADPASFTAIRLLSGAVVLLGLLLLSANNMPRARGSWWAGVCLFAYAALFSFAYVRLDTATGALILFGAVQLTMVVTNIVRGQSLAGIEWAGFLLAVCGLVYLLFPELSKPSLTSFIMMLLAGVAWAAYTLKGQGSENALADTAFNFIRTLPLMILLVLPFLNSIELSQQGVLLAVASGGITSGVGYAIWYAALRGLSTTQAAVIQLLVPIIAAIGGVMFANELLSERLVISATLVLGGTLLVILTNKK